MELTSVAAGTIRPEDNGAAFEKDDSLDVQACLGVNPPDMPRTAYWANKRKHYQKLTMHFMIISAKK